MSWAEAKMLSDVVVDSTRFSEVVAKSASTNNPVTINGSGAALCYSYGTSSIQIDDAVTIALPNAYLSDDHFTWIPFNKKAVLTTERSATVYVFLHDNISIGGGQT